MNSIQMPATMADASAPISMSSREIAELTGKRHDNVKRDIEAMLDDLEIDVLKTEDISEAAEIQAQGCWVTSYLDSMNRRQAEYHLDLDLTMTLITGYNAKLRHRVVVRVRELEEKAAQASLTANQPPYRFRVSTGRPELDDQLNLIQAVSERLPINNEVRAAMLVQFLREHGVPLNIARTDLMRYLCRLVTPPGGVVLDPFMGSGSTGKAAMLEGFRFIGCELSPEYLKIAKARIHRAMQQPEQPAPSNGNARPGHEATA